MDKTTLNDQTSCSLIRNIKMETELLDLKGVYHLECFDSDGKLKWADNAYNQVTFQGKNGMLDTYFAAGTPPATWYCSLITAGTETTAGTYAVPVVTEITTSSIAARIAMTWSASSAGSKSSATVVFSILNTVTITGNMVVSGGTGVLVLGNTAATNGILFSAGTFTGGSKSANNGDTINVSYSISV